MLLEMGSTVANSCRLMSTCPVCAPGRLDPKRQRPDHRPAQQGSESRTPNRGRRTRTGA